MSGTADVVVAGGVQNMSAIPISAAMIAGRAVRLPRPVLRVGGWRKRYGDEQFSQFRSAEMIAAKWGCTRRDMEEFALRSHQRAIAGDRRRALRPRDRAARRRRRPIPAPGADTTLEKMAALPDRSRSSRRPGHRRGVEPDLRRLGGPAGDVASGPSATTASRRAPAIHHLSVRAADPVWMLTAPIPATAHALAKTGLAIDDIDLSRSTRRSPRSCSPGWPRPAPTRSGSTSTVARSRSGHPLGATGARLMTTLLHELERTGGRYGLQAMCEGGGQANVTIIERL